MQSEVEEGLEATMARLSVRDGETTHALEQLPPVPTHNTSREKKAEHIKPTHVAAVQKKQVLLPAPS